MSKQRKNLSRGNPLITVDMDSCLDLPCHVYLKSLKGVYLECNLPQAISFGYPDSTDILGCTDRDFFSSHDFSLIHKNDTEVLTTEAPKLITESVSFNNTPAQPLLSFKIPYRQKNGKIVGIFGISVSINESFLISPFLLGKNNHTITEQQKYKDDPAITRRESQCLNYLVKGLSAKEIARILQLSPRTIEFYIDNMKKKFGCHTRIELVAEAFHILN